MTSRRALSLSLPLSPSPSLSLSCCLVGLRDDAAQGTGILNGDHLLHTERPFFSSHHVVFSPAEDKLPLMLVCRQFVPALSLSLSLFLSVSLSLSLSLSLALSLYAGISRKIICLPSASLCHCRFFTKDLLCSQYTTTEATSDYRPSLRLTHGTLQDAFLRGRVAHA